MLREIKIIDDSGVEIKPEKNNLIVLPKENNQFEFISEDQARNMLENIGHILTDDIKRIIRGQLNILEAEKIVRKTGDGKHKENINRKTGCTNRGA